MVQSGLNRFHCNMRSRVIPWHFTAVLMMLSACSDGASVSQADQSQAYATILEALPYAPVTQLEPEPYSPTLQDRRWRFADKLEEQHLPMLRRLKRGEIGNFGGIEWRWRDGPENDGLGTITGVAYFLNEPAATLRRYTGNPLFQPATAGFARTDQDRIAREWADRIGDGIASPGFGNIGVPWINIALPRAEFEAMRTAKRWAIPPNLALRFSEWAEPDLPAVPDGLRPLIRYFPNEQSLAGPTPDLATYDAIVLRDGCFFIDEEGADDPLAMFPLGVGVHRDREGHLAFRSRHSANARQLARVGTRMQLGYRAEVAEPPPALIEACGRHRVVSVKSLDQAAGYGGVWFAVQQNAAREGLSKAEALRQANDCLLEQERVLADKRLRGGMDEPQCCEMTILIPPTPPVERGAG